MKIENDPWQDPFAEIPREQIPPYTPNKQKVSSDAQIKHLEALLKFKKDFQGLVYDKETKGTSRIFKFVSHAGLVSSVSSKLAEVGLVHYCTSSTSIEGDNMYLTVHNYLCHTDGYYTSFPLTHLIPHHSLRDAITDECTSTFHRTQQPKKSTMNFFHAIAKTIALSSKYGLQALLGIAGGEDGHEGEEDIRPPKPNIDKEKARQEIKRMKTHE